MKTATKMILGLGTATLLATAAFAYSGENGACNMKNKQHKMMKMNHHKKGDRIIGTIMRLDLTPEQRTSISKILQEARASKLSPSNAFTAKEFNKEMFVKLIKEQRESKIEKRAQTIEKVYALLNEIQKKNLKTMLDIKALKQQKTKNKYFKGNSCNDKNCNGRG